MFRSVWRQALKLPVAHGGGTDFIFACGACVRNEQIHREMLSSPSAQAFLFLLEPLCASATRHCFATQALVAKTKWRTVPVTAEIHCLRMYYSMPVCQVVFWKAWNGGAVKAQHEVALGYLSLVTGREGQLGLGQEWLNNLQTKCDTLK